MGTTFSHDGVLDVGERREQADRCLKQLLPHVDEMTKLEASFATQMKHPRVIPTQKQLNWLKDLCEKYDR